MPDLAFDNPWVLALAIPLAVIVFVIARRTLSPLRPLRRAVGGLGLLLALGALVLAVSGVYGTRPSEARTVWVLVDRSLSAGEGPERIMRDVLADLRGTLGPRDFAGVIGFAGTPEVLLPVTPAAAISTDFLLPPPRDADQTRIALALELASRLVVPGTGGVALLVSDGHDTGHGPGNLEARAAHLGLRVYALPVDSDPPPEAALVDLRARVAGDSRDVLAADLDIHSTVAQQVGLEVLVNGRAAVGVRGRRLEPDGTVYLEPGRNTVRVQVDVPPELPDYRLEVGLLPEQDTLPENNRATMRVRGDGQGRVLVVHGEDGPEDALVQALRRGGLTVDTGPAHAVPQTAEMLDRYQGVVLDNVASDALSLEQHRLLDRHVRNGAGMAMLGGGASFGPGGYYESLIEGLLPVTSNIIERDRQRTHAIVVALDRSGSMGARVGNMSKMELANEGCVRTINLAPPGAMFGMLSVDTRPEWIIPLSPLTSRRTAAEIARSHQPGGGGIYVDIAAEEAFEALAAADVDYRHLILFSDGSDTERQGGVLELTDAAYREYGITTTAICLGDGVDRPFLENMARAGRGRFFLVTDPDDLPAVFSREAAFTAGGFIREDAFVPVPGVPGSLTDGLELLTRPLLGYVGTTARPQATVWLWADEERERPLLATWNIELGRTLAFTSDARDRWADLWLESDEFAVAWQRWVRWLLPSPERIRGVESEWSRTEHGPSLELRFFDDAGRPRPVTPARAHGLQPGGTSTLALEPAGTGAWRLNFTASGPGVYEARVLDGTGTVIAREQRMFVPTEELLQRPANVAALRGLAQSSGGALVSSARERELRAPEGARTRLTYLDSLLWAAVIGLFLSLGARRMPTVWRRKTGDTGQEAPAETAVTAFRRVQSRPGRVPEELPAWGGKPKDAPPPPEPDTRSTEVPKDATLSALRKALKEGRQRDGRDES
jgi:Ca-activated chloride channel homolog